MHLLIIAGFAGSGKTTFLLELIKALSADGRLRLAVIENDAGQVGIDDHLLRGDGLPVREIYSGCICCSLRIDLVNTLLELEREHKPDVVLLEPSGVAGPRQVLAALEAYGGEIDSRRVVTLIDSERFQAIQNLFFPLFSDGIQVADLIVMNKSDRVDESNMSDLHQRILDLRADAPVLAMSALDGSNVREITERIQGWVAQRERSGPAGQIIEAESRPVHHDHDHDEPVKPAVFARKVQWEFSTPVDQGLIRDSLHGFISALGRDLGQAQKAMLGHLKTIVKAGRGSFLLGSLTRCGDEPQFKGALPREVSEAEMIVNVIVYGMDPSDLETLVLRRIREIVIEPAVSLGSESDADRTMADNVNDKSSV